MSDEPVKEAAFFSTIRSWGITRSDNRVFGGVLSGIGARMGMAPAPARIIFVILAVVTGGISLLAYAAAWALLPDSHGSIIVQDFGRGRPNVGALIALVVLTVVGFIFIDDLGLPGKWGWLGDGGLSGLGSVGTLGRVITILLALAIPLAVVGGIIALIVWAVRSSNSSGGSASGYARLPDGTIPTGPAPATPADAAVASPGDVSAASGTTAPATTAPATKATARKSTATAAASTAASATVASATAPAVTAAPAPLPPTYAAPSAPPVYTAPPRPRVPGPGRLGYLLALAWIPLSIAITVYLSAQDRLAVYPVLAAGVIWVAGLGVILAITALRGRKLGFLGFVSVVALIPVGVLIGTAEEVRADYAISADRDWGSWWSDSPTVDEWVSEVPVEEPDPFDPTVAFADYPTVAIDGSCWSVEAGDNPYAAGTVSLAQVPADQSLTLTSTDTRLIIPRGTNLSVVSATTDEFSPSIDVTWADRDVACSLNTGVASGVTLTDGEGPTLTVRLSDAQQMGSMSLWIEEN